MPPVDPETIFALSSLKWWSLMILIGGGLVWWHIKIRKQIKLQEITEASKGQRAERYAQALEKLADSVHETSEKTTEAVNLLREEVKALSRRARGRMTFSESMRLVEAFFSIFSRYCVDVLQQCIREGSFNTYPEHIEKMTKSKLGQRLAGVRQELRDIGSFGLDPDEFFTTYVAEIDGEDLRSGGPDRFILVSRIWSAVLPHLSEATGPQAIRLDACEMAVRSEVADYLAEISNGMKKDRLKDIVTDYSENAFGRNGG